MAFFHPRL